ncbi:calcium-binding protein [Methylovulum psychrotolerans]|uniref:Haemolysin-type calcium binding-related domain-containing protein n=1 Tax=Methylovulum psychrotolerans TaxID=1704499 RepID=A0A1Z4C4K9_9GAMM|nr:calcium-binding protein [Methylovulum psychrotolerans]ASF48438.1 hypothetical protein CEK71_21575 [Methylovulum psychrotolerans]
MATYNGDNSNNSYLGTAGNDVINGNGGNDTLYGEDGNDIINGGTGNDYMEGGIGNDTYLIAKNDGADTIYDEGGTDVVKFTDMLATDISRVSQVGSYGLDLLLTYSGGQITFKYYFSVSDGIEQFQFSNGTVWNTADINLKVSQGTSGNDHLYGDGGNNTLNGLAGNDALYGYNGNDTLNGGTGNDTLYGGWGNDTYLIAKNDGTDALYDENGTADVVKFTNMLATDISQVSRAGVNGNDVLLKYSGGQLTIKNYFYSADNRIEQFQFSNGAVWGWTDINLKVLQGTSGNDILKGTDGNNDTLNGLAGNDTLYGYGGNDTLNGGTGNDYIDGGLGNDTYLIAKNDGADTIVDEGGTDVVKFTNMLATDISSVSRPAGYYGNGSDLLLKYSGGQLVVRAYFTLTDTRIEQFQFSNGTVWSWADIKAHTVPTPTSGNDSLYGYDDSNDTLNGLAGNDKLWGFGGNDVLNGGLGNDTLIGGLGHDSFVFNTTLGPDNIDTITDFSVTDDTIQLAHSIFTALATGALAADQFKILGNGGVQDSNDHILYNTTSGALSYDTDGSGAAAAVQIAILGTGVAMTSADFMVV